MSACPIRGDGGAAAGKLFQFSGYYTVGSKILATRECDAYDPATDKSSSIANIPQAISHCGQVVDADNATQPIFWLAGGFLGDHPRPQH